MISQLKSLVSRLLPKTQFARGVGVLVGGTASAQLPVILAAPLLTRLYTPDDFGLLAIYASLLGLFCVIASLRYELAIPLPKEHDAAAHVVLLSLLLVCGTTMVSGGLVFAFGPQIARALGAPLLAAYLWLLPVGVLLSGTYNVFNYWAIRNQYFGTVARTRVQQSLATIAIQLVGFKLGGPNLLFSQAASQSIGTLTLGKSFISSSARKQLSWAGVKQMATRYKRFPIYSTWEGLFNTAGLQLPPLLFAALFSPAAAGLYSLANRVLSLPMSLIGSAIGQVFFVNAAEAHREGRLGVLVAQLHSKLAHIGLAPALLLMLAGPDLFALVFGNDWRQAGEFARWMAPWLYLVFVSSPLSTLFAVTEQQTQGLAFQVILLVARIGAIYWGATLGDINVAVMLFATASALCWLGFLFWVGVVSGNRPAAMLQPTLSALWIALLCAVPLALAMHLETTAPGTWPYGLGLSGLLIGMRLMYLLRKVY